MQAMSKRKLHGMDRSEGCHPPYIHTLDRRRGYPVRRGFQGYRLTYIVIVTSKYLGSRVGLGRGLWIRGLDAFRSASSESNTAVPRQRSNYVFRPRVLHTEK